MKSLDGPGPASRTASVVSSFREADVERLAEYAYLVFAWTWDESQGVAVSDVVAKPGDANVEMQFVDSSGEGDLELLYGLGKRFSVEAPTSY